MRLLLLKVRLDLLDGTITDAIESWLGPAEDEVTRHMYTFLGICMILFICKFAITALRGVSGTRSRRY